MHLSCLVSSCLVLSCLLLSCLVLRDSGRMFRVSLLRCLVCLARSLFVFFGLSAQCHICLEDHFSREGEKGYVFIFCFRCCVLCVVLQPLCLHIICIRVWVEYGRKAET